MAVARMARGHDAIEQIHPAQHRRHDVVRIADPHQVARPLPRQVGQHRVQHCQARLLGLPDGQPADREPGKAPPGQRLDPAWRVYARSASDDKAQIFAMLAAVDALNAAGVPLDDPAELRLG